MDGDQQRSGASYGLEERVYHRKLTRRDFLWLATVSTASTLAGCIINPVTGEKQLILMSEADEIGLDRQHSPHQFSADYGVFQNEEVSQYLNELGQGMARRTHRPHMPYSFQAVNATYINAYAFPGGSIAVTRGILVNLDNEAELAGLLGHELGHVNARHTAARQSKGKLAGLVVAGGTAILGRQYKDQAKLIQGIGAAGAGLLLAKYSRNDERQADDLGMQYMVEANQNPNGMVGLMGLLREISKHKPSAMEAMFSSHPMSDQRYATAQQQVSAKYSVEKKRSLGRDRYMDNIAGLRKIKSAINSMDNSEGLMRQEKYTEAEQELKRALKVAPRDYAALVMMAKCQMAQEKYKQAEPFVQKAQKVYPQEAQAQHLGGVVDLSLNKYDRAHQQFLRYEKALPGNPMTIFLQGMALEGMQNKPAAAKEYSRFLKQVNQGEAAQHAYKRLVDWGYVKVEG